LIQDLLTSPIVVINYLDKKRLMNELEKQFLESKDLSIKWKKYFNVYEELFFKFKNKKIVFVEIGIANGGSLKIWKNYFGKDAKIIGIDLNENCKKFEDLENDINVIIGNQSSEKFWDDFFKKFGNVDIILDDGGHTNLDQITTAAKTLPHINDGGFLVVEDTHTSYLKQYNSDNKFSFINFTKKLIDDLNSNISLELNIEKKKYSLRKLVYSYQFFESIVVFKVDRTKSYENYIIKNSGKDYGVIDLAFEGNEINIKSLKKILKKIPIIRLNKFTNFLKNKINNKAVKKYFE